MFLFFAALLLGILSTAPVQSAPWTLPQGGIYLYAGGFHTQSQSFFNSTSERTEFLNDGTSRVSGLSFEGSYGITHWLMVSGSLPILWYRLEDNVILDEGRSLGDTRVSARFRVPFQGPIVAAVETGIKVPTATAKDPTRARVGEGQYDFELMGSIGKRLPSLNLRASLDAGYRWRRRNNGTGVKPGNEVIYRLELSYDLSRRVTLNAFVNGFNGEEGDARLFGRTVPTLAEQELTSIAPNLTYRLNRNFEVVLSANIPLAGKRSYAGQQFVIGMAFNRSQWDKVRGLGGFSSPSGGGCCSIQ